VHRLFPIAALLSFAALATPALAWDPAGHMLVGQIAWEHTKPAARERVTQLVQRLETTYNEGQRYHFITAGCWMDDMRSKKGYPWAKWHYVTIDWTPDGSAFALPGAPHVVWAIEESLKTLRDPDARPEDAALAVAMLIHFVGDVHQPLHATDRGDRGGNGVLISGVPFSDLWPGTIPNLHTFWDKAFRFDGGGKKVVEQWNAGNVANRPKAPGEGVIPTEAAKIAAEFPRGKYAGPLGKRDPVEWAKESHAIGCTTGYPANARPSDVEVAPITPEFASKARLLALERIALAGYRLADLLNELLAK